MGNSGATAWVDPLEGLDIPSRLTLTMEARQRIWEQAAQAPPLSEEKKAAVRAVFVAHFAEQQGIPASDTEDAA